MPENRSALALIVGIGAAVVFVVGASVAVVRPGDLGDDGSSHSPADTAAAEAMVLIIADLPPDQGWSVSENGIGDSEEGAVFEAQECEQFGGALSDDEMANETGGAESDTFERGALESPESSVVAVFSWAAVFDSVAPATAAMGLLRNPQIGACLGAEVRTSFEEAADGEPGPVVGEIVSAPAPAPPVGEEAGAVRITTQITAGAVVFPVAMDVLTSRRGRSIAFILVLSIGTPLADAEAHALLQKMIDRAPAA